VTNKVNTTKMTKANLNTIVNIIKI